MDSIQLISAEKKGLLGLMRDLGKELGRRLEQKFTEDSGNHPRIDYWIDNQSKSGGLKCIYEGGEYLFSSDLCFETSESPRRGEVFIDELGGVEIKNNYGERGALASPEELMTAGRVFKEVRDFLEEKYGRPQERGGLRCYKTEIPEKFLEAVEQSV